jgi:peptide/nickel transport system substrate-binding protein
MNFRKTKWLVIGYLKRHRAIIGGLLSLTIIALILGRYFSIPARNLLADSFSKTLFVEGMIGPVSSINPLFANSDSEKDIARLLFRGLTKTDVSGVPQGDLAASWDIDPSGKEYIFHLKTNLKFQNGSPITADDVAYTYNLAKDPKYGSTLSTTFKDLDVQALDDNTILFHLRSPFSPFLSLTDLGVLPQTALKHQLDRGTELPKIDLGSLGSTNFKLTSFGSDSVTLTAKNTSFNFRIYQSEANLKTALKLGEIQAAAFTENPELTGWRTYQIQTSTVYRRFVGIFYNERSLPTNDKTIRQALSYAVDKDKIISQILNGAGEKALSPIPPTSWAKSDNPRTYAYAPDAAQKALDGDGWAGGPIRSKAGKTLEISLSYPDSPQYRAVATQVAEDWAKIGVRALLNPLDVTTFQTKIIGSKSFQAAIFTEEVGADPDQYVLWHTTQKDTNITGMSLPKLDKALEDGRETVTQTDRIAKYLDFQRFLLDESPVTMLYYPKLFYVVSNKIQNVKLPPLGTPSDRFNNILDWKIQKTIL